VTALTHDAPQEQPAAVREAAMEAELAIAAAARTSTTAAATTAQAAEATWGADAEKELRKIPFFVRGKARRNTEIYARDKGLPVITIETLYDAKAHFSR
jgi:light-independent protochlorophyllide reductase subunit B